MASLEEEEQLDSKRIGKQGLSGSPFFVSLVMHFDKVRSRKKPGTAWLSGQRGKGSLDSELEQPKP